MQGRLRVVDTIHQPERKAVAEWEFLAIAIRGQVSGIGYAQASGRRDIGAKAGGEAANRTLAEGKVEHFENGSRRKIVAAIRSPEKQGRSQSGCNAFAADVAEKHTLAAVFQHAAAIEVASHFAGGQKGGAKGHPRRYVQLLRHQHVLHLAGGSEFAAQLSALVRSGALVLKDVTN
jgi:hypothetical protein